MDRRHALKCFAALPLAASAARLYAAPAADARLLVVFLRGGYDAANVLVPVSSRYYYETRPTIAVAAPGSSPDAALRLDSSWGLHPALRHTLLPFYQRGELAFIPFAGTEDLTRSHFETQDSIELGQPLDSRRDYRSGFLSRLASVLATPRPIAFTSLSPVAFRGSTEVANIALKTVARPGVDARQTGIIASMYERSPLRTAVDEGLSVRDAVMQEMEAASRNAVSAQGFELEARRIALLMRERFNLGFVDIGGWDTHVGEGGATGPLATRLDQLGRGLAAYAEAMGEAWRSTAVVVISEFGRTFRENGNRGTDHGHGTVYWVLGGAVRGGRVAGEQHDVRRETLFQDRDYPVLNEYRRVLGGLFARLYGLNGEQLARVFAGAQPLDLGLA